MSKIIIPKTVVPESAVEPHATPEIVAPESAVEPHATPETVVPSKPGHLARAKKFFGPLRDLPKGLGIFLSTIVIVVFITALALVTMSAITHGVATGMGVARALVEQQNAELLPYVSQHEYSRADLVQVIHPSTPRWLTWVWATPRVRQGLATEVLKAGQPVAHWAGDKWVPGAAPALSLPKV